MRVTVEDLLQSLGDDGQTLLRRPNSTVLPRQVDQEAAHALEALRGFAGQTEPLIELGELGRGGMAVVTLARQVSLDRLVAVKALRPDRGGPADGDALLAEAWRTGRLEHPNIPPVHSLRLNASGQPELVMKRIEGQRWSDDLRANPVFDASEPAI
jgi:serine/threonine-protein kinase